MSGHIPLALCRSFARKGNSCSLNNPVKGAKMKMLTVIILVAQSFLPLSGASEYHKLHHYGANIMQEAENTIDVLHDERLRRSLTPHLVNASNCPNCSDRYKPIDHKYYESLFVKNGQGYWRELQELKGTTIHHLLSDSYLGKQIYKLKFGFPYYGHILNKVMLTTGGFLYMDELDTKFLTDVQYVAPLMAQFNPYLRESSDVLYNDDGEKLTVQWSGVHLQNSPSVGPFSFQCTLHKNGSIWFAYKQIPIPIDDITRVDYHPVRVGIADAFVIRIQHIQTRVIYRTFYIYSAVNITTNLIVNGSAVIFTPKKTCVTGTDCEGCIMLKNTSPFNCFWCPQTKKCSDGADRYREEWEREGCSASAVKELTDGRCAGKRAGIGAGAIVGIVLVLLLVIAVGTWCVYAYKYPNSKSGLFLIEATNRPKKLFSRSSGGDGQSTTAASSDVKPQVL